MNSPATNAEFHYARSRGAFRSDGGPDEVPPHAVEPFTASTRSPFPHAPSRVGDESRPATLRIPRDKAYRLCGILVVGDWVSATAAIFLGLELREWQRMNWAMPPVGLLGFHSLPLLWSLGGGTLFIWLMAAFKTYEVRNLYRLQLWSKNLATSVAIWSVAAWAYVGLFQVSGFAPRIGVMYCALTMGFIAVFWRFASFTILMQSDVKEAASSRVIVVGWNENASHLWTAMRRDVAQLREIIGCVPMPDGTYSSMPPSEIAMLGSYPDLSRCIAECGADSIILSDVTCSPREIQLLIQFCQREMLGFQMVPEYFPALNSYLQVQALSGVPLLGVGLLPLDRTANRMVKRLMDITGALVGLLAAAALVPIIGLFVYFESPGPILRKEQRASRSGRIFNIYKIRTCRIVGTRDSAPGAFGSFVQRYDLDELPQFWNVLVGDMSLVGPYPERPELFEKLKDEIPNYSLRHEVRAGLTGWSQINGVKGDGDVAKRLEGDLYYLRNWNVMVDVYCIAATLFRAGSARLVTPPRENA